MTSPDPPFGHHEKGISFSKVPKLVNNVGLLLLLLLLLWDYKLDMFPQRYLSPCHCSCTGDASVLFNFSAANRGQCKSVQLDQKRWSEKFSVKSETFFRRYKSILGPHWQVQYRNVLLCNSWLSNTDLPTLLPVMVSVKCRQTVGHKSF